MHWHTAQQHKSPHRYGNTMCVCGGRAVLKPALERDLISPKTSHFSSHPPPIISLRLYLYSCSTSPIMDLAARCAFLLSSFAVLAALDLDAIDPGYYVETSSPSDVIDYKDPCKAENARLSKQHTLHPSQIWVVEEDGVWDWFWMGPKRPSCSRDYVRREVCVYERGVGTQM
ncbi:hypothetical protein DPX16_23227 [Anabarilius grahami]|uniref:Uncharacterized protein n=1 Tax=Anabarilius grahami TaxID=495550 RepID=A0A3N0YRS1_ANAGA|nr:hypothetical protein DPX16_23227 [Anabarilius grahami]